MKDGSLSATRFAHVRMRHDIDMTQIVVNREHVRICESVSISISHTITALFDNSYMVLLGRPSARPTAGFHLHLRLHAARPQTAARPLTATVVVVDVLDSDNTSTWYIDLDLPVVPISVVPV